MFFILSLFPFVLPLNLLALAKPHRVILIPFLFPPSFHPLLPLMFLPLTLGLHFPFSLNLPILLSLPLSLPLTIATPIPLTHCRAFLSVQSPTHLPSFNSPVDPAFRPVPIPFCTFLLIHSSRTFLSSACYNSLLPLT